MSQCTIVVSLRKLTDTQAPANPMTPAHTSVTCNSEGRITSPSHKRNRSNKRSRFGGMRSGKEVTAKTWEQRGLEPRRQAAPAGQEFHMNFFAVTVRIERRRCSPAAVRTDS